MLSPLGMGETCHRSVWINKTFNKTNSQSLPKQWLTLYLVYIFFGLCKMFLKAFRKYLIKGIVYPKMKMCYNVFTVWNTKYDTVDFY